MLADGTVKEYRYQRGERKRFRIVRQHGAIRFLAEQYVRSPEFKKLSALWQSRKRYYLGILEDELDWMTLADLNRREARGEFYSLRDGLAETPDKADKLTDTLKGLLAWGYERGHLDVNHALGIKHLAPSGKRRPDKIWTEDQQALYLAAADRCIQRAFLFSLYTSMRKSDACERLKAEFKHGWLTFQPHKTLDTTGVVVQLPVFALTPLREILSELMETPSTHLLVAMNGEPLRRTISAATTAELWRERASPKSICTGTTSGEPVSRCCRKPVAPTTKRRRSPGTPWVAAANWATTQRGRGSSRSMPTRSWKTG